jgi:hypothetical protein
MQEGFEKAKEALETGAAKEALVRLIDAHRSITASSAA